MRKISNLTSIFFQMGWFNHQLENSWASKDMATNRFVWRFQNKTIVHNEAMKKPWPNLITSKSWRSPTTFEFGSRELTIPNKNHGEFRQEGFIWRVGDWKTYRESISNSHFFGGGENGILDMFPTWWHVFILAHLVLYQFSYIQSCHMLADVFLSVVWICRCVYIIAGLK